MEYTGQLVTGDFGDNTMTFKIDGEMTLQAGKYKIVQLEVGNAVKNNVDLDDVVKCCVVDCREPSNDNQVYCDFHSKM
jgi:hypothetical protein